MTRSKTLKKVNTFAKNKAKGKAVKKRTPTKQKAKAVVSKKASAPVKSKTQVKAVKKVNASSKQKAKAVVAKKASAPVKHKTKVKAAPKGSSGRKKVSRPPKHKTKAVVKKAINGTKGGEKNTKQKAKPTSQRLKAEIVIDSSPIDIHGEDLHFIPEHDGIMHPVKPLEAHKMENIFQHKEEVAFHQENQKIRNSLPSRKSMKVFNRNKGK